MIILATALVGVACIHGTAESSDAFLLPDASRISDPTSSCVSQSCCGSACCDPLFPNMIGDGGLLQPKVMVIGSRTFMMQNHAWKASENNSAIPQDRFSFNFSSMQHAKIGIRTVVPTSIAVFEDLQEYRFAAEKTILSGMASLDVMVPFYNTSRYNIPDIGSYLEGPQTAVQFGDIGFGAKILLYQEDGLSLSTGVRVEAPTSEDVYVLALESRVADDVWHFTPYLAVQWTNHGRWFMNGFASYRLNSASMHSRTHVYSFHLREAEYLMFDASLGYWLIRKPMSRGLTGLASILELHYTTTPRGADLSRLPDNSIPGGVVATGDALGKTDYLNLTAGLTGHWNERVSVSAGFSVPLRSNYSGPGLYAGDTDRSFDWAFLVNTNYHF